MNQKINRAVSLFGAHRHGAENLAEAQVSIARDIVGNEALEADAECRKRGAFEHSDKTGFEATEDFGIALAARLNVPKARYDLRVCEEKMFRNLWAARQAADTLGIPYAIYIDVAVQNLQETKAKSRITPKMLTASDVQLHVMDRWNEEMPVSQMGGRQN